MIMAVALLVGAAGIAGLYAAVTGQSVVDEVKAVVSGGTNPGRTAPVAGQALGADKVNMSGVASKVAAPGTQGMEAGFRQKVSGLLYEAGGKVTITSGYRTNAQQRALRVSNGCPDVMTSPASSCRVPTAIPGTSKHEKGLAVDFGGDLALAARLAPKYGLRAAVPGEPWHFE